MKIAILATGFSPIPPPMQGGTEWIAYHQARGLAQRGHNVTLLAGKGSAHNFKDTSVRVIEVIITEDQGQKEEDTHLVESSRRLRLEAIFLGKVCQKLIDEKEQYDVILNNMRGEAIFLPLAKLLQKPFVNVMHLNLFPELADLFRLYNTHIITISNSQRKNFSDLSYLATVYNGVEVEKFPLNETPEDYLLMMGSIGRHKNQGAAISVAKKLGMRLILAGKIRDEDYFKELKKDIDGGQIRWIGELTFDEKVNLYRNAKAFLFPILWEEPFGLVMIEAMSCGVPVVAFAHGAVPEVVEDGKTGFVVESEEQMIEAVRKIDSISRAACREHVENNFTVEKMIEGYDKAIAML